MDYLIKANILIAVGYIFYMVFLRKLTFFNSNRLYLIVGLIIAVLLPLITIPIYKEVAPVNTSAIQQYTVHAFNAAPQKASTVDWETLLIITGLTGTSLLLLRFGIQIVSICQILKNTTQQKKGRFTFLHSKTNITPFSFFKWIVFNPNAFNTTELNLILTHEKVHASQWHTLDVIVSQIFCALFWYNPFMWLYKKTILQNLEFIADAKTQQLTNTNTSYQKLVLKTSVQHQNLQLATSFYNSLIKKRITMLNTKTSTTVNKLKYLCILPVLGLFVMSMNTETVYVEKSILHKTERIETAKDSTTSLSVTIKSTSKTTSINNIITFLKNNGITMTVNTIKRNKADVITHIDLSFSDVENNVDYNQNNSEGITPIYFKKTDTDFGVFETPKQNILFDTKKVVLGTFKRNKNDSTYIYKKNKQDKFQISDTLVVYTINVSSEIDTTKVASIITEKQDVYYQKQDNNSTKTKTHDEEVFVINENNTTQITESKALILINDKEVPHNILKHINPKAIKSVSVLKDKTATALYGDKGKHGVIKIELNNAIESLKLSDEDINFKVENLKFTYDGNETEGFDYTLSKGDKRDARIKNYSVAFFIDKNSKNEVLKAYKKTLNDDGIKMTYSKLKRNKSNQITSLKITLQRGNDKATATYKSNKGISPIEVGYTESNVFITTDN